MADGTVNITGLTGLGLGGASPMPELQLQNRYSEGDDIAWTKGSHSYALWRVGGSRAVFRVVALHQRIELDVHQLAELPGGYRTPR